jgi:hypothetical protein
MMTKQLLNTLGEFRDSKNFARAMSLLTVGAVIWPITWNWREKPGDSFPLSHYPMFSAKRRKKVKVFYALGLDKSGGRYQLPYTFAGTGGLNQVRKQIRIAVQRGNAEDLCRTVTKKVSRDKSGKFDRIETVKVVTGTYRLSDYFSGDKEPFSEEVHAAMTVERKA